MNAPRRIIRKKELPAYLGVKRTSIDRMLERGELPQPMRLTDAGKALGWFEDEIAEYQERIAKRRKEAKPKPPAKRKRRKKERER